MAGTREVLLLGLSPNRMEDTTNLHKKMIQTLSCQTLVPPLVLIYDPVRDSQTPADKKRKKRITGLVHG